MDQKIDLTKGGVAVVVCGHNGMIKEYANDARIRFIDSKTVPGDLLVTLVPDNTKVMIITEGLPNYHQTWSFAYAKRKNIPYLVRKSNQAIYETLKGFFANGSATEAKPSLEEVKETQQRGKLTPLLEHIDYSKSNAENAKILLRKAIELSIKTTEASLAQVVAIQRRKQSGTTVPKSARSQLDVTVEMLDETIKDLTSMRDYLISVTEENRILRTKLEKFKKVFED